MRCPRLIRMKILKFTKWKTKYLVISYIYLTDHSCGICMNNIGVAPLPTDRSKRISITLLPALLWLSWYTIIKKSGLYRDKTIIHCSSDPWRSCLDVVDDQCSWWFVLGIITKHFPTAISAACKMSIKIEKYTSNYFIFLNRGSNL